MGSLMKRDLLSKFQGCLLGQAAADAIGFLFEGRPSDVVNPFFEKSLFDVFNYELPEDFGQYTDDTQMALAIAEATVLSGEVDPAAVAYRFCGVWKAGVIGRGAACDDAVNRLMTGTTYDMAGAEVGKAGNGTAMRAGPVGLYCHIHPDELVHHSTDISTITHKDPRATAAAITVAGAVSTAIAEAKRVEQHGGDIDPVKFCARLAEIARETEPEFAESLREIPGYLNVEPNDALSKIVRVLDRGEYPVTEDGISPYAPPTVHAAVYAFLRSPADWVESVRFVLCMGGDTDTTAAITGAISGAFNGIEGVPKELAIRVHDRGKRGYVFMMELAEKLLDTALFGKVEEDG